MSELLCEKGYPDFVGWMPNVLFLVELVFFTEACLAWKYIRWASIDRLLPQRCRFFALLWRLVSAILLFPEIVSGGLL